MTARATDRVDCIVIGAGVVGLAVARALALAGREVVVLERHDVIGSETSSRNSEVIHAGIYYPAGSAKARLCVTGKTALYQYCRERQVPHARCGKIIVATQPDNEDVLRGYQQQAQINGAGTLRWLSGADVRALEPDVRAVGGVLSETTGIIDSHAYMLALQGDLEAAGGVVAFETEVERLLPGHPDSAVRTPDLDLAATTIVNCAGLWAPELAATATATAPEAYFARGHYYALSGASPFERLVYPVAEPGGLGVHVTIDLGGQAKFGPDVMWIDDVDYSFDGGNRDAFVTAIRRYYPDLDETRLHPSYTGIRPKISAAGQPAADFRIDGPEQHGVPGLINLFGIESPGLTASLAIAACVADIAAGGSGS